MTNDEDPIDSLMPAEQAVMDAESKRVTDEATATAAAQTEDAPPADAAPAQPPAPTDQARAPSAAEAAAAAVAASSVSHKPIAVDQALAKRDFDAERKALDAAWEEGDLSQSEWAAKFSELADAKAQLVAQTTYAQMQAQGAQEQTTKTFEAASEAFLRAPENADLADPTRFSMFQGVLNTVDAQTGHALDPVSLLVRAQAEFRKIVPLQAPVSRDPPPRNPDLSALPPRLTGLPQAAEGDVRGKATVDQLASMDIEDLEERFAGMGDDAIARILAQAPGAEHELRPVKPSA